MTGLALVALMALPRHASAQIPPDVLPFIDLKCYNITDPNGGPLPPLNIALHLDQLNPLLLQLGFPPEDDILLNPTQLCVPVAKNGVIPPDDALTFIKYIDLKCYNTRRRQSIQLQLNHSNPVLQNQPVEQVILQPQESLCVPVAKVNPDGTPAFPPPDVQQSVQFIDQKCYPIVGLDGGPLPALSFPLHLDHLNPVLTPDIAPPEDVLMQDPRRLCVPVKKNGQSPPAPDLRVIEQIDLKCYGLTDQAGNPLPPLGLPQTLFHLDPVLAGQPPESVLIQDPQQLCVPVSKQLPGAAAQRQTPAPGTGEAALESSSPSGSAQVAASGAPPGSRRVEQPAESTRGRAAARPPRR